KAWDGWCAVLHPSDLQLLCEAPQTAKPGARIIVSLKTSATERVVPVQLIVKDQRLIAPSDPQVELAACIKKNLGTWHEQAHTGEVDQQLSELSQPQVLYGRAITSSAVMPAVPASATPPGPLFQGSAFTQRRPAALPTSGRPS